VIAGEGAALGEDDGALVEGGVDEVLGVGEGADEQAVRDKVAIRIHRLMPAS
jgi:hypothetical protein